MKRTVPILLLVFALNSCNKQESKSEANLKMTQLFFDNLFTNPEVSKSLLHNDFTFSWMGTIEQGGVLWNRDNLFDEYFKNIIPEILPNGIILKKPKKAYWRYSKENIDKIIAEDRVNWLTLIHI